jgi:hypothetical protein
LLEIYDMGQITLSHTHTIQYNHSSTRTDTDALINHGIVHIYHKKTISHYWRHWMKYVKDVIIITTEIKMVKSIVIVKILIKSKSD